MYTPVHATTSTPLNRAVGYVDSGTNGTLGKHIAVKCKRRNSPGDWREVRKANFRTIT